MAKFHLKPNVIALRVQGLSLLEISRITGLSKSTISNWCRDITLTIEQIDSLHEKMIKAGHGGRLIGARMNRKKKEQMLVKCREWAQGMLIKMSNREFFVAGIGIYWGEGSKSIDGNFSFVNSDPKMILFMIKWLKRFFDVKDSDLSIRLSINEIYIQYQENILNYWSNLLELPKSAFKKTIVIKTLHKKEYADPEKYHGLLILRVYKSTMIKRKILALINAMNNADVAQVVRASHS